MGIADAAGPSLGNLAVSVVAARTMTLADFGAFTTALLALIMATGISRSLHGDVLVLTRGDSPAEFARRASSSLASVVVLGSAVGAFVALVGFAGAWLAGGAPWASVTIFAGVVLPLALIQDHYRWIEYAQDRIGQSLLNNGLWVATSVGGMVLLTGAGGLELSGPSAVLLWGLATVPGVVVAAVRSGVRPRFRAAKGWLRANRRLAGALVQDFGLLQASGQGALILLAVVTSSAEIGLLRKTQIWFGPVTMATVGLMSSLQSVLAGRYRPSDPDATGRMASLVGLVAGCTATLYGAIVYWLPADVTSLLVGEGWDEARSFVWPLSVQLVAGIAGGCAGIALRVLGQVHRQVRIRWFVAPSSLALVAVLGVYGGALWGAWALAGISVLTAGLWFFLLHRPVPTGTLPAQSGEPTESMIGLPT